jgi:hypothetical protein
VWQTSDWAVAASLWQRGSAYSGRATVAVLLCLLPYAVLALVLFRPFYRLQARGLARIGRPALTLAFAACCWLLAGPLVVVGADLALVTYFLCADPQRSAQLIYYERLRMLTEVGASSQSAWVCVLTIRIRPNSVQGISKKYRADYLCRSFSWRDLRLALFCRGALKLYPNKWIQVIFESIPQSLFQLSLGSAEPLIVGSVCISWVSAWAFALATNLFLALPLNSL